MGAYFTQFRRILQHRQVTRLEQGQVAIQSTSMNISLKSRSDVYNSFPCYIPKVFQKLSMLMAVCL
jgi:hypothetical protein